MIRAVSGRCTEPSPAGAEHADGDDQRGPVPAAAWGAVAVAGRVFVVLGEATVRVGPGLGLHVDPSSKA